MATQSYWTLAFLGVEASAGPHMVVDPAKASTPITICGFRQTRVSYFGRHGFSESGWFGLHFGYLNLSRRGVSTDYKNLADFCNLGEIPG